MSEVGRILTLVELKIVELFAVRGLKLLDEEKRYVLSGECKPLLIAFQSFIST